MIQHHPQAEILRRYAIGALNPALALVVACHVEGCEGCGAKVAVWESLGGALLKSASTVPLAADALDRTIARITAAPLPHREQVPDFLNRFSLPVALRFQAFGVRRWVSPRIWVAPVRVQKASPPARTYLIWARPGTAIPTHAHRGAEFTVALHGSFQEDGNIYDAGDFAHSKEGDVASPIVTAHGDCLCLVGAEAPMRLFSVVTRAVQFLSGTVY